MNDVNPALGCPIRVCFPFVGDDVGGSHISALKLIQNFDPRIVTPVVVLQEPQGPLARFLKDAGQPFVPFPMPETLSPARPYGGWPAYVMRSLPHIRRFIKQGQFDIVHTNDARIHVSWGIAARLAGARLVWHHRGDPDAVGTNFLAPLIADQMVAVSQFAKPRRPIRSLNGRISVVHSPFEEPLRLPDRGAAKTALLAELGLGAQTRVLSYVGGIIERKRPLLFVDIIKSFHEAHPEIPVVGCVFGIPAPGGEDLLTQARARAAGRGIGDLVRFLGFRSPIEPALAATDILIVPAIGEPFGRTLIEAMLLGTPVVATNHGGNPEAIQHGQTGYLVQPEDPGAFVEPIRRLLAEPLQWQRISRAAQQAARSSYSNGRHVDAVMHIYAKAQRPRRGPDERTTWAQRLAGLG